MIVMHDFQRSAAPQVEDAVAQMLDDAIVMTQSMGFSPFKAPFAERIAAWDAKLRLVSDTLDAWLTVQRGWMYLEPIFASPDIAAQLPLEAKRFATVDRAWRKAADGAVRPPAAPTCTRTPLAVPARRARSHACAPVATDRGRDRR